MRFIDRVRICVRAGDGGNGAVAWRREAHVPQGGPAGGDGGNGGSVLLEADGSLTTLLDLKFKQQFKAEQGTAGANKGKHGRNGSDTIIRVPVGSVVFFEGLAGPSGTPPPWREDEAKADAPGGGLDNIYITDDDEGEGDGDGLFELGPDGALEPIHNMPRLEAKELEPLALERNELMGDLRLPGQQLLVARGGRGGRGNLRFKTSTNRAPDRSEPGGEGDALWVRIELKLLADVGVVGFPNVGKSTLIRAVSRARPEVGDYPFTTLTPQLGVISLPPDRAFVMADVPGLVRGASDGRGLGHRFLKHLERTRVLLHLVAPDPAEDRSPLEDLDALEQELRQYGDMFEGRPRVVALNKVDSPEGEALVAETRAALRARNIPLFPISAHTGEGIEKLLEALWRRLERFAPSR